MIVRQVVLGLCCIVAIKASVQARLMDDPTLDVLERKCLTYRVDNTKKGFVRFRVTDEIGGQPSEWLYETTYDESRIAQVRRGRRLGIQEWGPPSRIILTPKEYIWDLDPDVAAVRGPRSSNSDKKKLEPKVSYPQLIGLDLNGANSLSSGHLNSVMISPSYRGAVTRTQDKLEGMDVWCLSYQTKHNAEVRVWFAPAQGHGVVLVEHSVPATKTTILVRANYKQYPTNSIWYPSRLVRTVTRDRKMVSKQSIEVEEAKFGQPIPASTFTISALGIEPGRQLIDRTSKQARLNVWDGKQLVDPSKVRSANQAVPVVKPSKWRIAASGTLALLAMLCCWWVVRRRASVPAV